jgi:hypothetical protein
MHDTLSREGLRQPYNERQQERRRFGNGSFAG